MSDSDILNYDYDNGSSSNDNDSDIGVSSSSNEKGDGSVSPVTSVDTSINTGPDTNYNTSPITPYEYKTSDPIDIIINALDANILDTKILDAKILDTRTNTLSTAIPNILTTHTAATNTRATHNGTLDNEQPYRYEPVDHCCTDVALLYATTYAYHIAYVYKGIPDKKMIDTLRDVPCMLATCVNNTTSLLMLTRVFKKVFIHELADGLSINDTSVHTLTKRDYTVIARQILKDYVGIE